MVEYKTLRVPEDAYEVARDAKKESETWGDFLQRCSDTRPEIVKYVEHGELSGRLTDIQNEVERLRRTIE